MPYYQLPTGKTVYLTLEQLLDLDDRDLEYLLSVNAGQSVQNPWHGSTIHKNERPYIEEEEDVSDKDDPYEEYTEEDDILDHEDLIDDETGDIDFDIE